MDFNINYEYDRKIEVESLQFQWAVSQSQLQRLERTLRELRVTSLAMSIVLVVIVGWLISGNERVPTSVTKVALVFGTVWWAISYVSTLLLPMCPNRLAEHYMPTMDFDMERFEHDLTAREQAKMLEANRYQVYQHKRIVKIITQFVAFGVALTLLSFSMAIMMA